MQSQRFVIEPRQSRAADEPPQFFFRNLDTGRTVLITQEEASQLLRGSTATEQETPPSQQRSILFRQSYETLLRDLYGLPVELPR